ncbi:MAG: superoxide dismutase family protein [Balneolaceae bacterium]
MLKHLLPLFALSLVFISCEQQTETPAQTDMTEPDEDVPVFDRLVAVIHPTDGNEASGVVTFSREGDDIRVIATISDLEPESRHGFHIHEYGDCSADDGTSAGGHFSPYGMRHGAPTDDERHMGDMGNLAVDEEGVATIDYVDTTLELEGAFSIAGRGVVVHAGEDDLESQPTGDAGARIGCGVIGISQPVGQQ